jgi:nucleoid-associated protein YgaU
VRLTILATAAALLLMPGTPASAVAGLHKAQSTDFSAAKKKKPRRAKAEKVEYMRAAPSK